MSDRGNDDLQFLAANLGGILRMYAGLMAQTQEAEELKKRGDIPEDMVSQIAFQRVSQRQLEEFQERLDSGDDFAVIDAMSYCIEQYVDVPDWLRNEFITRHRRLTTDGSLTLDDAFGPRFPKNAKRMALSERRKYALVIYHEVEIKRMAGAAIDEGLFEEIAERFDLSMSTVRRHYYWFKDAPDLISASVRNNMRKFIEQVRANLSANRNAD